MRRYSAPMRKDATSVKGIGNILAQTTGLCRNKWDEVTFGCFDTPADAGFRAQVMRCTAAGTGTAITARPNDPGEAAASALCTHIITVEGTLTAASELLDVAMNQRTTFRWVAPPDGELWGPATNNAGLSANLAAATTTTWAASVIFQE